MKWWDLRSCVRQEGGGAVYIGPIYIHTYIYIYTYYITHIWGHIWGKVPIGN